MYSPVIFAFSLVFHGAVCDREEEGDKQFALKYLTDYNYLSQTRSGNHDMTAAIKRFQKFFGLPVTGRLDEATLDEMKKPRCGVPDFGVHGERMRVKRYSIFGKWSKTNLKYYVSYGEDLSEREQSRIFAQAFKLWTDAAPKLKITRTYKVSDADLKIRFYNVYFGSYSLWGGDDSDLIGDDSDSFGRGRHSGVPGEGRCHIDFDGKDGILGHAFNPEDGGIHFDEDENFSETGSWWTGSQSLIYVAAHEIGHALGLYHSSIKGTLMFPIASRGRPKLHKDDIAGIRKLYGR